MKYKADFTQQGKWGLPDDSIYDFVIEADNKLEAKKQIKAWFEVKGEIRIIEA